MHKISVGVKKLTPDAKINLPSKVGDVGFDISVVHDAIVKPGEVSKLHTGIVLDLPDGIWAKIEGRSGLATKGLIILGGIIDTGYRGEIIVLASSIQDVFMFKKGDRVAQIIFHFNLAPAIELTYTDNITETDRGSSGFGSTGV